MEGSDRRKGRNWKGKEKKEVKGGKGLLRNTKSNRSPDRGNVEGAPAQGGHEVRMHQELQAAGHHGKPREQVLTAGGHEREGLGRVWGSAL